MLTVGAAVMVVMMVEAVMVMMMMTVITAVLVVMVMVDVTAMVMVAAVMTFAAWTTAAAATSVTFCSYFGANGGSAIAMILDGRDFFGDGFGVGQNDKA